MLFMLSVTLMVIAFSRPAYCWSVQTHEVENELPEAVPEESVGQQRLSIIVPGTKWCGSGNVSSGYDDLGRFEDTDKCCRQHDYCDDVIEAGETKNGLTNPSFYTRLNCNCDQTFYDCLKASDSSVSNHVGAVYFNVLGTQCYRDDYPIVSCKTMKRKRCVEYEFDEGRDKMWQWFDVPIY